MKIAKRRGEAPGGVCDRPDRLAMVSIGSPVLVAHPQHAQERAEGHHDIDRHVEQHRRSALRVPAAARPISAKPTLLIDE